VTPRRRAIGAAALLVVLTLGTRLGGQNPPPTPLRLITPQGSRPLATLIVNEIEMVALDELAAVFPIAVRDDASARAITVTWQRKTVVLPQDQPLASVSGRLVSLPVPPARIGGHWFVPIDVIPRALALVAEGRLELRKASRLVIAGPVRVPRVVVRHELPGPQARVTFEISPPTPHTVLQQEGRLLIRFDADLLDVALPTFTSQGLVQAIRTEPPVSVVLELGPRFASFRASDVPVDATNARLVIDISGSAEPSPTTESPVPVTPETPVLPLPGSAVRVIVLDPGHGGQDTGARGAKGTLEKDVALAVARRTKAALESRFVGRVLLTRDDDRLLGTDERASMANNNKADLFVSLHVSASLRTTLAGAQVFYLAVERAAAATPDQIGPPAATPMPVFGGGTRDIDVIAWEQAQVRYVDQSAVFARVMSEQLRGVAPLSRRSLQQAPLRVLVGANMPAILVEVGYVTNPSQATQLANGDFQARLAQAIAEGIARYDASRQTAAPATGAGR
jgi:N-acetylmuramoyl-L-alanine amidase